MAAPREQHPTSEVLTENPAGASRNMITVPNSGRAARPSVTRFDSRRVLARRRVARELDEWFGIYKYPDPNLTYAAAPSREAAPDE